MCIRDRYQCVVRYEAADTQITNVRISSSDNKVERMAGFVSWLSDVLNAVKRLQQLQQLDCIGLGVGVQVVKSHSNVRPIGLPQATTSSVG